ncbi:hypothetical protein [Flavobacterium foetidum]|uniref:hypothetical protein n=1 Tax=Flavobacterium foetidum TaxID=2026681 RepID=UPI001074B8E7|nr:hypothetical protein [Flavobacterium foetidum]KAF2518067.1 hypothetical protein E0W73_02305 [Flavobacterium foetidum]
MKKLYINTGSFDAVFDNLKDSFEGTLVITENEYKLNVKSKWAKGIITGVCFDEMIYLNFDLMLQSDLNLSIESNRCAPVFFAYCEKGFLRHSFGAGGEIKNLKKQQSGIVSNTTAINSVLYFESHKQIQFSVIGTPTALDQNSDLAAKIKKHFISDSGNYIYTGNRNAMIEEKITELKSIPQKGTVRYLIMKSILKEIVELEIAQHSYNYLSTFKPVVNIAIRQLDEIKKLSHNIPELIQNAGIAGFNYLPRIFKEKHLAVKSYDQKLAS